MRSGRWALECQWNVSGNNADPYLANRFLTSYFNLRRHVVDGDYWFSEIELVCRWGVAREYWGLILVN
jgi:hypothetical protein